MCNVLLCKFCLIVPLLSIYRFSLPTCLPLGHRGLKVAWIWWNSNTFNICVQVTDKTFYIICIWSYYLELAGTVWLFYCPLPNIFRLQFAYIIILLHFYISTGGVFCWVCLVDNNNSSGLLVTWKNKFTRAPALQLHCTCFLAFSYLHKMKNNLELMYIFFLWLIILA